MRHSTSDMSTNVYEPPNVRTAFPETLATPFIALARENRPHGLTHRPNAITLFYLDGAPIAIEISFGRPLNQRAPWSFFWCIATDQASLSINGNGRDVRDEILRGVGSYLTTRTFELCGQKWSIQAAGWLDWRSPAPAQSPAIEVFDAPWPARIDRPDVFTELPDELPPQLMAALVALAPAERPARKRGTRVRDLTLYYRADGSPYALEIAYHDWSFWTPLDAGDGEPMVVLDDADRLERTRRTTPINVRSYYARYNARGQRISFATQRSV